MLLFLSFLLMVVIGGLWGWVMWLYLNDKFPRVMMGLIVIGYILFGFAVMNFYMVSGL